MFDATFSTEDVAIELNELNLVSGSVSSHDKTILRNLPARIGRLRHTNSLQLVAIAGRQCTLGLLALMVQYPVAFEQENSCWLEWV
jgi:hypothetical protein